MEYNIVLIDDFPKGEGGSEYVNNTVCNYFGIKKVESSIIKEFDPKYQYIVSNISLMPHTIVDKLSRHNNYVILEHDYKFISSRHPWMYKDSLVPASEIINLELYKNAKAVFVQSDDHLSVFKKNNILANFVNLKCSIWSDSELDRLLSYYKETKTKNYKACVVMSNNWIKNTQGNIKICEDLKLDFDMINPSHPEVFLRDIAQYSTLVFFPIARESLCRLLVEARCMGLNTLTSNNSGAATASWYSKSGRELIDFLRKQSKINLNTMKTYFV
jgi:hypothetical protein